MEKFLINVNVSECELEIEANTAEEACAKAEELVANYIKNGTINAGFFSYDLVVDAVPDEAQYIMG